MRTWSSTMTMIAQSAVFWPGISYDIDRTRKVCRTCTRNAPSQASLEPVPPLIPTTPFEAIVADFFELIGMRYLVIADRLSGWSECYRTPIWKRGIRRQWPNIATKAIFRDFRHTT